MAIEIKRIAGEPNLTIGDTGCFEGADCLTVTHVISNAAAKVASDLVTARPWIGQLEGSVAEEFQTADALRGIGWLMVMTARKKVKEQLITHPQATNVFASIVEGKREFIPPWLLFSPEKGWNFFPDDKHSRQAAEFRRWEIGGWDETWGEVPEIGTPGAKASLVEMTIDATAGRLEEIVRELVGVPWGEPLTLSDTSKITGWVIDLPLALAREPRHILDDWWSRARKQIPSRTLLLTFKEPRLNYAAVSVAITLNNLSKCALSE